MGEDEHKPRWRTGRVLRTRARDLRVNSTDAEQRLWFELRAHRLNGLRFRRQHPLAGYVADFACLSARLIVEVDGGQHYQDAGRTRDARRDGVFIAKGYRVLRFSNLDVLKNLPGVLESIVASASAAVPPPQPSPASGRGGASAGVKLSPACGGGAGAGKGTDLTGQGTDR
ncbi:endonuclease domain-containing protein [Roseixanthobacter glucoisosaccharinicivorans]|uniref:endonuclease domain-containing protein n=1 Tax=Roseixanthobacter glucoisosaccharinicivorans TaxID=3119923 RepID=UPI00372894F4